MTAGILSLLMFLVASLMTCQSLRAQVLVDLSIKRVLYVAYEPLLVTVRITNLSGGRLLLSDVDGKKWFGFQIETLDGRPIPPSDPDYQIAPQEVGPGESITRTVNLTQLYPMGDFGSYRIMASIYVAELSQYFSSPPLTVEITEGRLIWQQVVGVPGISDLKGSSRTVSLLSHRLPERTDLYLRIEDKESGIVFCTHRLGDYISYSKPEVLLDSANNIHVLQNPQPRLFVYSKVGLNGKIMDRASLNAPKDHPRLRREKDGSVVVVGGIPFDPHASPTPNKISNLSERPVPLPTPTPLPTPKPGGKKPPKEKEPAFEFPGGSTNPPTSPKSSPLPVKPD